MTDAIPTTGQSPSTRDNYLESRRLGEYGHYILPLTDLLAEAALFLGLETDMFRYHKETCSILRASQGVHPEEAAVLYGLVRSLKPQLILETGTFEGYSTAEIARALQKNGTGHLVSVDIADKTGFRVPDNLQQFVTFRRSMSSLAMTTVLAQQKVSVELFFHDSAHTYCNALEEFIAFAPHVKNYDAYQKWRKQGTAENQNMLPETEFNLRYIDWSGVHTGRRECPAVLDERDFDGFCSHLHSMPENLRKNHRSTCSR